MSRALLPAPSLALLLSGCPGPGSDPSKDPVDTGGDTDSSQVACEPARRPLVHLTPWQLERIVGDLLGEDVAVAEVVPSSTGAWEGRASAQAITPAHVEGWWAAGGRAAERALARGDGGVRVRAIDAGFDEGERIETALGEAGAAWAWAWATGETSPSTFVAEVTLDVPRAGTWEVQAWAGGVVFVGEEQRLPGSKGPTLRLVAPSPVGSARVLPATYEQPAPVSWSLVLPVGPVTLGWELSTDVTPSRLVLDRIELVGPAEDPDWADPPARRRTVACDLGGDEARACADAVLRDFTARAWARPPTAEELTSLSRPLDLAVELGDPVSTGLGYALRAVLLSPSFLLRDGREGPDAPDTLAIGERLARLLWGSVPDATLRACAETGALGTEGPCALSIQVDRMLADPRADAVVRDFGRQWLALDAVTAVVQAPGRFPGASGAQRVALAEEPYALLDEARRSDTPLPSLLEPRAQLLSPELGAWYGVEVQGPGPAWVEVPGRGGLLSQAGLLAATSNPDRSSPVRRGVWVLQRLLCDPPDPAPAGVPALPEDAGTTSAATVLAAHAGNPTCARCYDAIDPLGLALEAFDHDGLRRTAYADGSPVDARGALPDGTEVDDVQGLGSALAGSSQVQDCLEAGLLAWALARAPTEADACVEAGVHEAVEREGLTFEAVLRAVALSEAITGPRGTR